MNFFTESRKFHLDALQLEPIVADLENNFTGSGPQDLRNYDEARRWYRMVVDNAGRIAGEFIAPRAAAVDEKGCSFENGQVEWAPETKENMATLAGAGLMGGTLPREYGGLNLPHAVNNVIVEMVSQADASLMNIFGLQDIAVTIHKFGTEEQKKRVLPRFASGEVSGSMALTEPDAGSDLQAVSLKAIEKDGKWYLDGVKRFITNGCGEISLVLARSEPDTKDGRGLSMFLYERDDRMTIRRIEDKLGIHGSPTTELQYNMAPAELVGKRRFGLIKYVMSLMDGARLGVSFQALGIAQASFEEARKYANEREQFGKKIVEMPPIYQMLKHMQVEIETTRALLNHTSLMVDYSEMYERKAERGENVRNELKAASSLAALLTPLSKFTATEMANKVAYDALQIHGGVGYMKDFTVERLYRDARITNIYEGTTQLQVVAAMGGITSGLLKSQVEKLLQVEVRELGAERTRVEALNRQADEALTVAKGTGSKEFLDYVANSIVEMSSLAYRAALYLPLADAHPQQRPVFSFFLDDAEVRARALLDRVRMLAGRRGAGIDEIKREFILQ